jgi:hypothetical protein
MSLPILTFNYSNFILEFPAFNNAVAFPEATLAIYWNTGTYFVSDVSYGWLQGAQRQYALDLMCAHLVALSVIVAAGQIPGVVTQATIDKISVSLQEPPKPNQWQWWLNQTPYGQQLLALLAASIVGGMYIGGLPELSGFRRVGGVFT